MNINDKVQFLDGRGGSRVFRVSGVNGKTFITGYDAPQETVELEFPAFGLVAHLRRVETYMLEKVKK